MITLIIHRDNGHNTCKCCVMESWNSYFEIIKCESREDAIRSIAEWVTKPIEPYNSGYTVSVMFSENNEMVVCEDITECYCDSIYLEELLKDVSIAKNKLKQK